MTENQNTFKIPMPKEAASVFLLEKNLLFALISGIFSVESELLFTKKLKNGLLGEIAEFFLEALV